MAKLEVKIPTIGESITEVTLGSWEVDDGSVVNEGEILCLIDSDKASVELPAEASGKLEIKEEAGKELAIGAVVALIDTSVKPTKTQAKKKTTSKTETSEKPAPHTGSKSHADVASPAARKILAEKGLTASQVEGSGKDARVTKADALAASTQSSTGAVIMEDGRRREKMSRLRKTIAKRLVEAKNTTAMLTTFNEVDMSAVMEIRKKHKEGFKEKHGVSLGYMSFFTKAVCHALQEVPAVSAMIDGEDIVFDEKAHIGIAVSTPKGLVVPVLKAADEMSLAEIEQEILRLATKAREGKLGINEMQGGNFSITNGGVFGSMLSTPILNIPQSAILGMHNIVERPHVVDGEIKIRPIMYVALSYDHRIIDGRESVTFLVKVKEQLENPAELAKEL